MKAWPHLAVGLLVVSAGGNIVMLMIARADEGFATPPSYYERAVRWDDVLAQEESNRALGWRVEVASVPLADGHGLVLRVVSRDGQPLQSAEVEVEACAVARASKLASARLAEKAPGVYEGSVSITTRGLWDIRARVRRGKELLDVVVRHEAG